MIILRPVTHQDKFANCVRTTELPDGTLFEFLSSGGHVHGQYQIDNPISHPPKNTIGAIKEEGVWYWVIRADPA